MQIQKLCFLRCCVRVILGLVLGSIILIARRLDAQGLNDRQNYARKNSFGVFAAYSPDSSHILLGVAGKRKLWDLGVSYSRRLGSGYGISWQYEGELLPIALVGDPLSRQVVHQTSPIVETFEFSGGRPLSCSPIDETYSYTDPHGVVYSGDFSVFCHGREWTVGQAVSPLGFRTNFLTRKRIQPVFSAHIGYMYSTQTVPVALAGSFNFAFDFGGGVELFRSRARSLRAEYRFHHISNHYSAQENPGIDNGLFQVGYVFGR